MIFVDAAVIGQVISYLRYPSKNPSLIIFRNFQIHCLPLFPTETRSSRQYLVVASSKIDVAVSPHTTTASMYQKNEKCRFLKSKIPILGSDLV